MEKCNLKATSLKRASFCNNGLRNIGLANAQTRIRLGISAADEKAKLEFRKRKLEAPLSIEEKILKGK